MNKLKELSYFCPAYNEEENLLKHIDNVLPVLAKVANKYELLIVNNGSTDKTSAIADKLAEDNKCIRVIHHESNRDYGGALKTGFENCRYEYISYTDSDLQFDFGEVTLMIPFLNHNVVINGIRKNRKDNIYRKFQSKIFNFIVKTLFGLKVQDINCSFKIIPKKYIDGMKIISSSAFIDAELLIKSINQGAKVKEVNITHYPRVAGAATGHRPIVILMTFKEIFQTFFSKKTK